MKEIANRWLPPLEEGDFSHNLLREIAQESSRLFRSAQRPADQVTLFVLDAVCAQACSLIDASTERRGGNEEYHEKLKSTLGPALISFLRAETEHVRDRHTAIEKLLHAYRLANQL